jgi:hypothetical protein
MNYMKKKVQLPIVPHKYSNVSSDEQFNYYMLGGIKRHKYLLVNEFINDHMDGSLKNSTKRLIYIGQKQ